MSQRRGTETDQLSKVIQVLQLGRKTGILSVERGEGMNTEEGEITFTQGHITSARIGYVTAQGALALLNTWGACRFLFTPAQKEKHTQPMPITTPITPAPAFPGFSAPLTPAPSSTGPLPRILPHQPAPIRMYTADEALRLLERAGLSRTHRRLLLLLDGKHTPSELARLMNRGEDEVHTLLDDLAKFGLVQH